MVGLLDLEEYSFYKSNTVSSNHFGPISSSVDKMSLCYISGFVREACQIMLQEDNHVMGILTGSDVEPVAPASYGNVKWMTDSSGGLAHASGIGS